MIKMNNKIKNFYGIGDAGFSFMTTVETSFFLIFLTDVAALPLAWAAVISTVTGICDIVTSLLAGVVIDKCRLKGGKYRPWMLYLPPIVMFLFALQFTKIGTDLTAAVIISAGFILSHAIWNIAWTAERSMVGVMTDDPQERAHISGRIAAGSGLGKLLASWSVMPLSLGFASLFSQGSAVWGYTLTALTGGVLMLITYWITYYITKGYDVPQEKPQGETVKAQAVEKVSFGDLLKGLFKNSHLLGVVFCDFIRLTGYYMMMGFAAYYTKVVFNDPGSVATLLLVFNLGAILGSLLTKTVVKRFGTKMSTVIGMSGWIIFTLIAFFLSPNQMAVIAFIGIGQFFYGISLGLTTSLYTNCAVYSEYKTGKNTKGFTMGLCSFSIKMSIVLRGLAITSGLGLVGYAADLKSFAPEIISGVSLLFLIVPVVLGAVALIPLLLYRISDKEVIEMGEALNLRKKEEVR